MRFLGHKICFNLSAIRLALLALLAAGSAYPVFGQTAPYLLPYTMSTYAGPTPAYTVGNICGTANAAAAPARTAGNPYTFGQEITDSNNNVEFVLTGGTASSTSNATFLWNTSPSGYTTDGTVIWVNIGPVPNKSIDTPGDGCFAPQVSVGADPHDVRVDGAGNVYYIDNSAAGSIIHKINPITLLQTVYAGSLINSKICSSPVAPSSKYGDGCIDTDGVANSTAVTASTPTVFGKDGRGLGLNYNGDLYFAGYNDYYIHKISASTGLMSLVAGNGATPATRYAPTDGTYTSSSEYQARGASGDALGNGYFADTGDNTIRVNTAGIVSTLTALSSATVASTTVVGSNVAANSTAVYSPEDVQIDSYGNIYIADTGNSVIRAIYKGTGTLIGVPTASLKTGNIYTIAGYQNPGVTNPFTYPIPTTSVAATYPATTVTIAGLRKFSIDSHNNLYIADSTNNVVWFVDAATANVRIIAGNYLPTATTGTPSTNCTTSANAVGDGCPAVFAGLYFNYGGTNTDGATSADSQGNLYITDAEGGVAASSRIRKALSGLNFPTLAAGSSVTQNILIHFAPLDGPAATNPYVFPTGTDYTVGTATCYPQLDTTKDCVLPITFKPSKPGLDTATLSVTSLLGGKASFVTVGTGAAAAIAFDPGNTALISSATTSNAQGVVLDGAGNAYIADTGNNRVLFYNATANTTTVFAGGGTPCGTATDAFGDGCPATAATLAGPRALAIDTTGSLYIADTGNSLIRKVSANGVITLYAGGATTVCTLATNTRGDGCLGPQAIFKTPVGLAADTIGNLYVSDSGNNVIRTIQSNGLVNTLSGGGTACTTAQGATDTSGDGCAASAAVYSAPGGLAYDAAGKNLFVADTGHNIVRKIYLGTTYTVTGTNTVSNIVVNPVTLVAGSGQAGTSLGSGNAANNSQLSAPSGVAVGANGTVYIADTGNNSIRMVTNNVITTIAGITNATGGTGTVGGAATATQFNLPAAVAVSPLGTLFIADSGNNRILTDTRSQITYNFGRTNITFSSPIQNFTELNLGTNATTLPTGLFVQAPTNTQFTLVAAGNSNGSVAACAPGTFASGALCNLQGQFTPTAQGPESVTYTQTPGSNEVGTPSITLSGTGAVLTGTTSTVAQTSPAPPTNSQYGSTVTITGTVTPASCNTAAPNCYPTGNITFVVDGVSGAPTPVTGTGTSTTAAVPSTASAILSGLAVGPHTISCNYAGDSYYAPSSCGNVIITVSQASTTSTLTVTNNNQTQYDNCGASGTANVTQCGTTLLTATVVSNTTGIPSGTVTFFADGAAIGTSSVNASTGVATLTLQQLINALTLLQISDNTLLPGTHTLTCTYNIPVGSNFAGSSCTPVTFTVLPQKPAITLYSLPCSIATLSNQNTSAFSYGSTCTSGGSVVNGVTTIATADGSTTDATVFVAATNTVAGTLTFSCSGLPTYGICTFSPTSITLTAGTSYAAPVPFDVTMWTDIQPSSVTSSLRSDKPGTAYAIILGWPLTLLGFVGILALRRKPGVARGLSLMALLLVMVGSSLLFTGCAGPGLYVPVLTPAGTYPVTVTVTGGGVTASTVINFKVASPGIVGQQ